MGGGRAVRVIFITFCCFGVKDVGADGNEPRKKKAQNLDQAMQPAPSPEASPRKKISLQSRGLGAR